jgi:hypothetical protein
VTKDNLEKIYNDLTKLATKLDGAEKESVQCLADDILNLYYLVYDSFSAALYRNAWDTVICDRLDWMNTKYADGNPQGRYAKASATIQGFKETNQATAMTPIRFGQLRIAANFAQAETIYTPKGVAGQSIESMGAKLQSGGSARDLLMVKVFRQNEVWVAINNRALACHSVAGLRPVRIVPQDPSADELNRLNETYTEWTYTEAMKATKERVPNDRTLPSEIIPITDGPNTYLVTRIVRSVCQ